MRSFLCEEAGFKPDQVLLCGDGGEEFSRDATRSTLRDILLHGLRRAQSSDNLWFFFSGHGLDDYLMTTDGNPRDLMDTAISIHFVTECLRKCKAKNVVLVLDMCRNESRDTGRKNVESIEQSLRELVKQREGQQGLVTLFSCSRGESSYEITELQRGAFTYALLEGLRSQSILRDLETHLARRVPELHENHGKVRKQVPLVIPEPGWKYEQPLLISMSAEVDIAKLKELAIEAELEENFELAKQLLRKILEFSSVKAHRTDALKAIDRVEAKMNRQAKLVLPEDSTYNIYLEKGSTYIAPPISDSEKNIQYNVNLEEGASFTTSTQNEPIESTSTNIRDILTRLKALPTLPELPEVSGMSEFIKSIDNSLLTPSESPKTSEVPLPKGDLGGSGTETESIDPPILQPPTSLNGLETIDYSKLQDLFKNNQWQKADQETYNVMLISCTNDLVIDRPSPS